MKRLYKMSDLGALLKAGPYIGPRGGKYADPQHKIPWNDEPFDPPKRVAGCDTCKGLGHRIGKQGRIDGKADAVSAPCPTCNPKGSFPLNRGEVKRRGLPQPLPTEGEKQRAGSKQKKRARDSRYRERKKVKKVQAEKQTTLALSMRASLRKGKQLSLFDTKQEKPQGKAQPPPGYTSIPGGKKGGFRKRSAGGWVYWYPGEHTKAKEVPEEVLKDLVDHEACDRAWGDMTDLLEQLDLDLKQWSMQLGDSGRVKRKEMLKSLDDIYESTLAKIPEPKTHLIAGLTVESIESSIHQHTKAMVHLAFGFRRRALGSPSADGDSAKELRDSLTWYGIESESREGESFFRLGRGQRKKRKNLWVENPDEHQRRMREQSEARDRKKGEEWETRWRSSVKSYLDDALKLPESHQALLKVVGARCRFLVHATHEGTGDGFAKATAEVEPGSGIDLVTMYSMSELGPEDAREGTTLVHELGHVLDHIVYRSSGGESLTKQLQKLEMAEPSGHAPGEHRHDRYGSWRRDPKEWFAEAYRSVYRGGESMKTTLQRDDFDSSAFKAMVDHAVREALSSPKRARSSIGKSFGIPASLLKAGGPYIGPRGGKYADPQHTTPWKEGSHEVSISEQPGRGFSVKLKAGGSLAGVLVVNEPKELSPEARRAVPSGKHPVSVAWVNVNDEHKRKGYGRAMHEAAVREAHKRGLVLVRADHAGSTIEPTAKKLWGDAIVKALPPLLIKARKLHGRDTFRGLDISIENRKGSYRYWWDEHANERGRTKMKYPYGYVRGTEGTDGDHLDVYLGPNENATHAYVVDQGKKGDWGSFDEQKVMLGFDSALAAKNAYLDHYDDPRFFQGMQAIPMDLFLETVTDPNNRGERIQKGGKYIKRVPYVDGKGRKRYRYYYSKTAIARDVAAGEVVRLGKRMVQILDVDGDTGAITIKVGKGQERRVTPSEWGKLVGQHHGSHYRRWAERRARSVIDAVQRHVPKELLEDLQGATDKERMADLQKKAPKVYAKLQKAFSNAGMSVHSAKRVIAQVMERRGWDSDSRALAIGSVIKKDTGSGEIDQLIRASENLSDGWGVKVGDVASAIEMRKGDFVQKTNQLADQADKEASKLEKALEKAKHGDIKDAAEVLSQSLDASAMHQLVQMLQAHPGLKMDAVDRARETLLEVPSAAPSKAPKSVGSETVLFVAEQGQAKALKARYRLMEAGDVVASHDPAKGFRKRDDYPEGVQERAYHKDRAEQQKVVGNALKLAPAIVVNTNPDAVNGPPMVTPDGHALGGNSRTMSMQKVYADHPEKAAELRAYLKENAHQFGLTEADVDAMENPILVREMIPPEDAGYSKEDMQLLVRQMNESFTQAMDPRTMQVALGRKLKQDTLDTLAADMEEGETLNKFLSGPRSDDFLKKLERDGVIDSRNANQYRKRMSGGKLGRLNEDGKTLVSRVLVGRIVGDADTLSNTQASVIKSVAMTVPALSRAAKKGDDYDLGPALTLALEARSRIAARGNLNLQGGLDDQTFRRAIGELDDMFDPHPIVKDPLATKVLEALLKRPGSRQLPEVFNHYSDLVSRESDEDQGGLLGIHESRSAEELLTRALEIPPSKTKKSVRFGFSLRKAGGGWETGPRGGIRRRVGNGWEYKGGSGGGGGGGKKKGKKGKKPGLFSRLLGGGKEGKKQAAQKQAAQKQAAQKQAAQQQPPKSLEERKEAYFQDIVHVRIASDIASAEREAGTLTYGDSLKRHEELVNLPPKELRAKMEEMGVPDPTRDLQAMRMIMGDQYYEDMPEEVAQATGVKTAGELVTQIQSESSPEAEHAVADKALEVSEQLKAKGQTDLSEATLVLARGLVKLSMQANKPPKPKETRGLVGSLLRALAKLVGAGLSGVASSLMTPMLRRDSGETAAEGDVAERNEARRKQANAAPETQNAR